MTNPGAYGLRIIKDFPAKGVNFIDINGLLADPRHFHAALDKFCQAVTDALSPQDLRTAAVISPESRGFFFGAPTADRLKLPFLPIRKKGKIPNNPYRFHITNEYDSYDMEMDADLLARYEHFIYIDDILATGQTLASIRTALKAKDKQIVLALHLTAVQALQPLRAQNTALLGLPLREIL